MGRATTPVVRHVRGRPNIASLAVTALLIFVGCGEESPKQPNPSSSATSIPSADSVHVPVVPEESIRAKYTVSSGIIEYRNSALGRSQTYYFDRYGIREALYSERRSTGATGLDVSINTGAERIDYDRNAGSGTKRFLRDRPGPLMGALPSLRVVHLTMMDQRVIAGKEAQGVTFLRGSRGARVNAWLWKGVPLRIEEITPENDTLVMEAVAVTVDPAIPAARFKPPKDISLTRVR